MTLSVRNLCFGYAGNPLFTNISAELESGEEGRPIVIMGPSGCGKTTFLKLLAGLLSPEKGEIVFSGNESGKGKAAFIFQEPRLLPWLTVLENVRIPLEKIYGKEEARERARHFLALVSLDGKERALPGELSGGEAQRVSIARAFAWPCPALFMDEPFQSLDVPLRKKLMELTLSLLEKDKRFLVAVTHDPGEAVYMGGRVVIFGRAGEGIVFDRKIELSPGERTRNSAAASETERELVQFLA